MRNNPFTHTSIMQCRNWHIYSLSYSRNNHQYDAN